MKNKILCGDSLEVLKDFEDNYFDSVVTDPPYGISFMSKKWDYDVPQVELWKEVYRVLKPGGHILSFAGSRTYHRMAVNIEDAGFEIRDMLGWLYGSGFPKSHNIGKAVDKLGNKKGIKIREEIAELIKMSNKTDKELANICNVSSALVRFWRLKERNIQFKEAEKLKDIIGNLIPNEVKREVVGKKRSSLGGTVAAGERNQEYINTHKNKEVDITKGNSEWEGWGTALKPAHEPIVMARKPFNTSVAENVLTHGTGGINIDECRVGMSEKDNKMLEAKSSKEFKGVKPFGNTNIKGSALKPHSKGRFPANIIHDGSEEVLEVFEESSRFFYCAKASKAERNMGLDDFEDVVGGSMKSNVQNKMELGGASLKGEKKPIQKTKNHHPTVKPIKLMEYLVRLVTPKEGIVLEPFAGSGTTLIACKQQGFNYIGIEREQEYCDIAEARLKGLTIQEELF